MFRFPPGAKLCKQVSIGDDTLQVEYLDGEVAEVVHRIPLPPPAKPPAQISFTPLDKKTRRWIRREITALCDESVSKEDFRNRMHFAVEKMLKAKRSMWVRVEKE